MQFLDRWMAQLYAWLLGPQPMPIRVVREEQQPERRRLSR